MKKYIIISLLIACSTILRAQSPIVIDQNQNYPHKDFILDEVADVSYVFLETRLDAFIREENFHSGVWLNNNDVFIVSGLTVLQFGTDGKFKRIIGREGRGPGEYITPHGLFIDEKKRELYVCDISQQKILIYNSDGKYLREVNTSGTILSEMDLFSENTILTIYQVEPYSNVKGIPGRFYLEYSLDQKKVIHQFGPYLEDLPKGGGGNSRIFRLNNDFIVSESQSDTIYSVSRDRTYKPLYVYKYKGERWAKTPYYESDSFSLIRFSKLYLKKNYQKGGGRHGVIDRNIYIDKLSRKVYETDIYLKKGFSEKVQIGPVYYCGTKNCALYLLSAMKLIELAKSGKVTDPQLKEKIARIDESSNPVLVIVRFKN